MEFKAELKDLPLARTIVVALGAQYVAILDQTDTYFAPPGGKGRLKRRQTIGERTEWVYYERADECGPKVSEFLICGEKEAAERWGTGLVPGVVVRKSRELYMLGDVRIHLDMVLGLGAFVEFEALVSARQREEQAWEAVGRLRAALGPALGEPISVGYVDLMGGGA